MTNFLDHLYCSFLEERDKRKKYTCIECRKTNKGSNSEYLFKFKYHANSIKSGVMLLIISKWRKEGGYARLSNNSKIKDK